MYDKYFKGPFHKVHTVIEKFEPLKDWLHKSRTGPRSTRHTGPGSTGRTGPESTGRTGPGSTGRTGPGST